MTEEIRGIVRIADKDVEGDIRIEHALIKAKGSSHMFANAVCAVLNLERNKKVGLLTPAEIEKIEDCMKNPKKYGIPTWLLNRRKDLDTGEDKHILSSDLKLRQEFDVRHLKKIRTYRGARHAAGLPVRGQKTRSSFRKGKAIGVQRKKKLSGKK